MISIIFLFILYIEILLTWYILMFIKYALTFSTHVGYYRWTVTKVYRWDSLASRGSEMTRNLRMPPHHHRSVLRGNYSTLCTLVMIDEHCWCDMSSENVCISKWLSWRDRSICQPKVRVTCNSFFNYFFCKKSETLF